MIDLSIHKEGLANNIRKAKENNIIIPTIAQMQHPETIPEKVQVKLKDVGLWDVNPLNLFRITWKNEAKESGGLYQAVPNYVEIPSKLSGVPCRIIAMAGKWFPTGCHKVGASFGCLAPRLVTGQFDATYHHAVWPSTGNYCRGGAFNSKLLACQSIAILPAEMSQERFDWLKSVAGEIIATPGFIGLDGLGKANINDCYTPVGTFTIDKAFGLADNPGCQMEYTKVDENYYWSGDSKNHFNELVNIKDIPDLDTENSEHIADFDYAYQYVLNMGYNSECEVEKGFAFFLHWESIFI